jgi:Protein of unknown function (DUF1778)
MYDQRSGSSPGLHGRDWISASPSGAGTCSLDLQLCQSYIPSEYTPGMSSLGQKRGGRINLRVEPNQEARLRAAAEANGETLTGFMLAAATERAD